MASSLLCFFRSPWVPAFAPLLVFALLLIFGFGFLSSFLTSTLLILYSTRLFTFSKQITRPPLMDKPVTEESFRSNLVQDSSSPVPAGDMMMISKQKPESDEPISKQKEDDGEREDDRHVMRSQDLSSESEGLDQSSTTEDSEADWPFRDNTDHSLDFSDGSISDEDSLIEIALPSGHYVGHHDHKKEEEEGKLSLQQKFMPDYYNLPPPYPIWKQHSLMELLAELNEMMNEEENLIEIDISMGSIKCPRFEIEA
ncbi:uncharacterized protein LOC110808721 isoform X1 [Carica papaya]|uniref:uncharacterized protein LOC110808721 isoform X1 n=2 Tax=Carica papaya TaxID=3649 RepID=UPI000B8CE7D8|nr:uncharacterized protein LOC110808721 isoform X1 [Carica papaya]